MSIDYDANYGVGFEIEKKEDVDYGEDGIHEYICSMTEKDFQVFQNGNYYSGAIEGVYLCVKNEMINENTNMQNVKLMLENEADRLNVKVIGRLGLFGGLLVS